VETREFSDSTRVFPQPARVSILERGVLERSQKTFRSCVDGIIQPSGTESSSKGRRLLYCTGILSSQAGSKPFRKFSTPLLFSTSYKSVDPIRSACK